jgi:hypothetical protein
MKGFKVAKWISWHHIWPEIGKFREEMLKMFWTLCGRQMMASQVQECL